jgi:hypothetical protein
MTEVIKEILEITEYLSLSPRVPGSNHHKNIQKFIKKELSKIGISERNFQKFTVELALPKDYSEILIASSEPIKGVAYSFPSSYSHEKFSTKEIEGEVVNCGYGTWNELKPLNLEGKIALVKEGLMPFSRKEKLLHRKGAVGIIVYREEIDTYFNGLSGGLLPVIGIKKSDVIKLINRKIRFRPSIELIKTDCINYFIKFGESSKIINLIAHYDTKPNTYGAIDNGLSVALLLALAKAIAEKRKKEIFSIRIIFTDCEEYGLLGAKQFVEKFLPPNARYYQIAVSVDGIGWGNPTVFLSDADGRNSKTLLRAVKTYINYHQLKNVFKFKESRTARSDHIPFREKGLRTLLISSHPLPFRHTFYDTFFQIDKKEVLFWWKFLKSFVLNFYYYLPS